MWNSTDFMSLEMESNFEVLHSRNSPFDSFRSIMTRIEKSWRLQDSFVRDGAYANEIAGCGCLRVLCSTE